MTRFQRSGFFRVSRNGNLHWVRPHDVERHDWERSGGSYQQAEYWRAQLDSVRARGSSSARFLVPNASCPECGADVYYYQNEHGSRVYFDEVGPPWPKHPCTDTATPRRPKGFSRAPFRTAPLARADDEIVQIRDWTNAAYMIPESRFSGQFGHKPWRLAELLKRIRGNGGTFLVFRDLAEGSPKKLFMAVRSLPRSLQDGTIAAIAHGCISYLELDSMLPRNIPVVRFRGASPFIDAMLDGGWASE